MATFQTFVMDCSTFEIPLTIIFCQLIFIVSEQSQHYRATACNIVGRLEPLGYSLAVSPSTFITWFEMKCREAAGRLPFLAFRAGLYFPEDINSQIALRPLI
jgi:hypothetical protein